MEQFLTPRLEKELSNVTMEYIYEKERTFDHVPNFVKRTMISKDKGGHENILAGWMSEEMIPSNYEAWEHLKIANVVPACICMAKLGDMVVHISTKKESPFNIFYCPEKMHEFQKLRMRLWWEYFSLTHQFCEINSFSQSKEICYSYQEVDNFFKQEQITDDAYIRTLALKFYPEEF